jgi:hypothetical protein
MTRAKDVYHALWCLAEELDNVADAIGPAPEQAEASLRSHAGRLREILDCRAGFLSELSLPMRESCGASPAKSRSGQPEPGTVEAEFAREQEIHRRAKIIGPTLGGESTVERLRQHLE